MEVQVLSAAKQVLAFSPRIREYLPMGKVAKKSTRPGSPERGHTPNAVTREAIEAVRRGEVEPAKDFNDLLKKLNS